MSYLLCLIGLLAFWKFTGDEPVPRRIHIIFFLLFFFGFFAVAGLFGASKLSFGLWFAFHGVIGVVIGRHYKDEIWQHGFLGSIVIGILLAVFG